MPNWNVVVGKKRGGPFSVQDVRRLLDTGKLSESAFICPDDDSTDWQEIKTAIWLVENPEPDVTRYCPECDSRILISQTASKEPVRCPKCFAVGKLVDYLDAFNPPIPDVPVEPWGPYDIVVAIIGLLAACVAMAGIVAMFINPPLSILLSSICLCTAGGLFGISFHHRSQTATYRTHLRNVENVLSARTERLQAAERELQGLRRGLVSIRNDMILDTEEQLRIKREEIERELEVARDQRGAADRIAVKYLEQAFEWWVGKLRSDNFQTTKDRLQKAIDFCLKQGHAVSTKKQMEIFAALRTEYERVARLEEERDEQKRIREQIREEQRLERELKRKLEAAESEQRAIERALETALRRADAEHSAEVELLRQQLRDAQEKAERAKSQAQLTKAGHVYVISNIGSFGEEVYKVGLTRRLEPVDRVRELGDASVPFPFDIHMMISADDAPKLEFTLHQALHRYRVNRVNFRKEFFRVDLDTIRAVIEQHHGVVEFAADPAAAEYRQSLEISDEDFDYLEKVAIAQGVEDEDDDVDSIEE